MNNVCALWCRVVLVALLFVARRAGAEDLGKLVVCDGRTIATLANTRSPDHRWALGWTLRGLRGHEAPKPWLVFDSDQPEIAAALARLQNEDGSDRRDADLVAELGWIDLSAKHFEPLPLSEPSYPGRSRCDLQVGWSKDGRYAVVMNNHEGNSTLDTVDAWLFKRNAIGFDRIDLRPGVEVAVRAFMEKRDHKDAKRYTWELTATLEGARKKSQWRPDAVDLPFATIIPGHLSDVDAGVITIGLTDGSVKDIVPDPAARKKMLGR